MTFQTKSRRFIHTRFHSGHDLLLHVSVQLLLSIYKYVTFCKFKLSQYGYFLNKILTLEKNLDKIKSSRDMLFLIFIV